MFLDAGESPLEENFIICYPHHIQEPCRKCRLLGNLQPLERHYHGILLLGVDSYTPVPAKRNLLVAVGMVMLSHMLPYFLSALRLLAKFNKLVKKKDLVKAFFKTLSSTHIYYFKEMDIYAILKNPGATPSNSRYSRIMV